MTPLAIIPLMIGILFCILVCTYYIRQHKCKQRELNHVGGLPGTNPRLDPEQQSEGFHALRYSISIELQYQSIDHPECKQLILDRSEILKIVSRLSLDTLDKDIGLCAPIIMIFRLPNGLEMMTHIWKDYWCFTGGPARHPNEGLWKFLNEKLRPYPNPRPS